LCEGLSVLGVTLAVVAIYGCYQDVDQPKTRINLFPMEGLAGVSQWFGCSVFGFGIVPLTFNFRESMAEPSKLSMATMVALLLVAVMYIIIGLTLLVLYPNIDSDVLSELPNEGIIPVLTRLSMVVVVMATAPLLIVPCGQIIEGKVLHAPHGGERDYHKNRSQHRRMQIMVRFGICFVTVAISVGIPEFVGVLTFVGCFCVAFVSFCIPPCLHLLLRISQGGTSWTYLWVDVLFLAWGLVATGISTLYVFQHSIRGSSEL
jgi:amino acid permease